MRYARWLAGLCLLVQCLTFQAPSAWAAKESALARIRKAGVLVVALDPDNLPYSHSQKTPPGFDVEISKELAKKLGVEVKFHWVDTIRNTPLGDLIEEECDCALGSAIEVNTAGDDVGNVGRKVLFTKPYYSTGYVLVVNEDGPRAKKLAELKGKKIGAEAGSVADYNLNLKGHTRRLYPRQEAIFTGLERGEIEAGFMWAPNVGFMLQGNPKLRFKLVEGYVPEAGFRWNIGAAVRKEDGDLKDFLDKAFQELVQSGQAKKFIVQYGAPYFPPFE